MAGKKGVNTLECKGLSTVARLIECETWDQRVASSRLTAGTVLWPLVQPRKTGKCLHMTEKFLTGM